MLFYNKIPSENYQAADNVIGKNSFEEKDYDTEDAVWPYAVKTGDDGVLAITDTQYYRVLIWHHWSHAFSGKADIIIGQDNLESCGQNQYRMRPAANTLNWCYDTLLQDGKLYIADTCNSRILGFDKLPDINNAHADHLLGNINFESIGEHLDVGKPGNERLYWPFAVTATEQQVIVADTGNHRIAFYNK